MKVIVVTANIGNIDNVIKPIDQSVEFDYYCFDDSNLPYPFPNLDNRTKSKYFKTQLHHLFPEYDVHIWIDGRIEIINYDFVSIMVEKLNNASITIAEHKERSNVFDELNFILNQIKSGNKYLTCRYGNQNIQSELDLFKKHNDLYAIPLYHCACFAKRNDSQTNGFFDQWWEKCIQYTNFDQAMFSYISYLNPNISISKILFNEIKTLIKNNKHKVYGKDGHY